jgi:predicted NBD/HSP70 family sugar kinase
MIDETARYLGVLCINLCRVLDPETIIMTGGMALSGDQVGRAGGWVGGG